MKAPFPRTTCACATCIECCKTQPGALVPGQMEEIAAHLGKSLDEVKPMFWASPGALVLNTITNRQYRIGTITPRYDKRLKRCVFLTDDDRCSIHPVAPAGCSLADTHMSSAMGRMIGTWMARLQQSEAYQRLRSTLMLADHYRPRGF